MRETRGDYVRSTSGCLANGTDGLAVEDEAEAPEPGGGFWYLVRGNWRNWSGPAVVGSWNACTLQQAGPRDAAIEGSGLGCY